MACYGPRKSLRRNPTKTIPEAFRKKVHTIFHHLTKEELVEKVLANYWRETTPSTQPKDTVKKKKKQ